MLFPRDCAYPHNLCGAVRIYISRTCQTDMLRWCGTHWMLNRAWRLSLPTVQQDGSCFVENVGLLSPLPLRSTLGERAPRPRLPACGLFCHIFHYLKVATFPIYCTKNHLSKHSTRTLRYIGRCKDSQSSKLCELSVLDWEHASASEAVNQPVSKESQHVKKLQTFGSPSSGRRTLRSRPNSSCAGNDGRRTPLAARDLSVGVVW